MALALLSTITTHSSSPGSGSTVTVAHTTDSGTDVLAVTVTLANISGVTFNGAPMSQLGISASGRNAIYYLANPDIGTFDIVASYSPAGSNEIALVAYNFSGADTTTPMDAFTDFGADQLSATVTTTVDDCMIIANLRTNNTGSAVNLSTGTERLDVATTNFKHCHGNQAAATAGGQTVTFTSTQGTEITTAGAVRSAQAAPGGSTNNILLLGV